MYKQQLESDGIEHFTVRPDLDAKDPEIIKNAMDPHKGVEFLFEQMIDPIRQTYEDLEQACEGAALIVSGSLTYASSLIHETKGVPWMSVALQATAFFSDFQFPVLPQAPWLRFSPFNHPYVSRALKKLFQKQISRKSEKWYQIRQELGLFEQTSVVFDATLSPTLQLAAYSPLLSQRQPDWPAHRHHVGFIQPEPDSEKLSKELDAFIKQGQPPVVFTLGSAAVLLGEKVFEVCLDVAKRGHHRSVFVCGDLAPFFKTKTKDFPNIFVSSTEPYSALFPQARVVVHQGGMGTTGEALRAGTPMIVLPFGQDQFDNAVHVARMKCGVWHPANSVNAKKLEKLFIKLDRVTCLNENKAIAHEVGKENGLDQTVAHIEQLLRQ
jgi:UDP:flavonoid glycosyltransferase YjiC (YdhE family)